MNLPLPEHHSNPETFKDEPVYIFTDDAIVPAPKGDRNGKEKAPTPPAEHPAEGDAESQRN